MCVFCSCPVPEWRFSMQYSVCNCIQSIFGANRKTNKIEKRQKRTLTESASECVRIHWPDIVPPKSSNRSVDRATSVLRPVQTALDTPSCSRSVCDYTADHDAIDGENTIDCMVLCWWFVNHHLKYYWSDSLITCCPVSVNTGARRYYFCPKPPDKNRKTKPKKKYK